MGDHLLMTGPERERQKAETAKSERVVQEQEVADLRWLMDSVQGRRTIARLLSKSGVGKASFHTNALEMARAEGRKQFGIWCVEMLRQHCFESFQLMERECKEC